MQIKFIGSGGAFGSGGNFNTCFHVTGDVCNFLIVCDGSSMTMQGIEKFLSVKKLLRQLCSYSNAAVE